MIKGYYTDKQGNVLGYFELPTKPDDDEKHTWVESGERPEIYVAPEVLKEREINEKKAQLAISDYKILKKLEKLLPVDDVDVIERQSKRDRINQLEAK